MLLYYKFALTKKNVLYKSYKHVGIFNILYLIYKLFTTNISWIPRNLKKNNPFIFNLHQFNFFLLSGINVFNKKNYFFSFYTRYYNLHNRWLLQFLFNQNPNIFPNTFISKKIYSLNYKTLFKKIDNNTKFNYFYIKPTLKMNRIKKEYTFKYNFNERKRLFTFMNHLYFSNKNMFIFNGSNLGYLYTYIKEYSLIKFLLSNFSVNKWIEFYKVNKFSGTSFFKSVDVLKFNIIPTAFFNKKRRKMLDNHFVIYQIKSIQWLLLHAIRRNLGKIFNNVNIHIRVMKYDLRSLVNTLPIRREFLNNKLPFQNYNLLDELIDSLLIVIFYKDLSIFIDWVKNNMRLIYFFKQNAFIILIKNLIEYIFNRYSEDSKFLGYKIIFKGKLNKLGNVRKKKAIITKGFTALSNVNYKSDYQSDSITTTTGVIGIKIIINYL